MTDLQAGLGLAQLKRIEKFGELRRKIISAYEANLNFKGYRPLLQSVPQNCKHAHHLYIVLFDNHRNRDRFLSYMNEKKIGVGVHYRSISDLKLYKNYSSSHSSLCENSQLFGNSCVSLPLGNALNIRYGPNNSAI